MSVSVVSWTAVHQASCPPLSPRVCSNSCPLSHWMVPSNHLTLCPRPSPPALSLSQHQGLSQWIGSSQWRWPKYWSFSFNISLFIEYSGLISLKIDCFDILAVQETLKSLLQHYNLKMSFLWYSAFFMDKLSHLYVTTEKTIVLTLQLFVSKVISLLFHMLSRFVIAFLLRSKHLLISWLQTLSTVILEPKKIYCHCFHFHFIYLPWSDGTRNHDLSFLNVEF